MLQYCFLSVFDHQNDRPNFFSTETFHWNVDGIGNVNQTLLCIKHCFFGKDAHRRRRWVQETEGVENMHAHWWRQPTAPTAPHTEYCAMWKNGSWNIVLNKITWIWCLRTDKIWYSTQTHYLNQLAKHRLWLSHNCLCVGVGVSLTVSVNSLSLSLIT